KLPRSGIAGTRSEADSSTQLNPPGAFSPVRRNDLAREHAKVSRAIQTQRGRCQVDVVKYIKEVGRDFEPHPLCNPCLLAQSQVQVPEAWPAEIDCSPLTTVLAEQDTAKRFEGSFRIPEQVQPRPAPCRIARGPHAA